MKYLVFIALALLGALALTELHHHEHTGETHFHSHGSVDHNHNNH